MAKLRIDVDSMKKTVIPSIDRSRQKCVSAKAILNSRSIPDEIRSSGIALRNSIDEICNDLKKIDNWATSSVKSIATNEENMNDLALKLPKELIEKRNNLIK